jgi:hypothetical protein
MTADTIARLKITLDNVEPTVLRRIEVPLSLRLDRLHLAIQAAMVGPTVTFTRSVPGTSDGVFPIPTGVMAPSTLARHVSSMHLRTPRSCNTSTTLATAGNTPSRSSVYSMPNRALPIGV